MQNEGNDFILHLFPHSKIKASCRLKQLAFYFRMWKFLVGFNRQAAEADDSFSPVTGERRIGDAFARRSVIKTVGVGDDAHVSESVEKDERSEFIFFFFRDRLGTHPEAARAGALKRKSGVFENAPDKAGTIVSVRSFRSVNVTNTEFGLNRQLHFLAERRIVNHTGDEISDSRVNGSGIDGFFDELRLRLRSLVGDDNLICQSRALHDG